MDSSSENSFMWTDASNPDSDDSDLITSDVKMSNHNHNENEYESEKAFKKKLHKQLFQEQGDSPDSPTKHHKKSKKKEENDGDTPRNDAAAKQEQTSPESVSYLDRQLKQEELDNSSKKKQKKSKKDRQLPPSEEEHETDTSVSKPEKRYSEGVGYLDSQVKQEDLEYSPKKKQKKSKKDRQLLQSEEEREANTSSNEPEVKSEKRFSDEVSYLDHQVKHEHAELASSSKKKHKKSKKDRQSSLSESMNDDTVNGDVMQVDNESVIAKKRKRKSDSQSETGSYSDMEVIIDKFEAEETIVQTPVNTAKKSEKSRKSKDKTAEPTDESAAPAKKKRKLDNGAKLSLVPNSDNHTDSDDNDATALPKLSDRIRFVDDDSPLNTKTSERSQTKTDLNPESTNKNNSSPKKSKVNISTNLSVIQNSSSDSNDSDNSSIEQSTSNTKNSPTKAKSVPKLSDKIRFEDDEDLTMNAEEQAENVNKPSYNMKCFLKANPNLKRIDYNVDKNTIITKDDELWLLTCPQEMDVDALKGKEILLDSKCKVKVNGNTFDGLFEEQSKTIGLLATYNNQVSVINLPLMAAINFRRRIPKAHFVQDSGMVNNQTNFIPLPSTKCRHPLFGPDYKKAIKIPTAVKARLALDEEAPVKKKKKKSKRSEYEEQPSEPPVIEPKVERTKSKKRKHLDSNDQEPTTKKIKKVKHEPESNEVWESEKAIEKNLFNF